MNAIPKFSEQVESIELARLTAVLIRTAQSLVALSSERDTLSVFDGHTIAITYVGRGFESIGLFLSNAYSTETRIRYMTENLNRLMSIKKDISEEIAA